MAKKVKEIKEVKNVNEKIVFAMLDDLAKLLVPITSKYIGTQTLKAIELKDSIKANFDMYSNVRTKLCEKYCTKDEKGEVEYGEGNVYKFPEENKEVIELEMYKLNTTIAEVKNISFNLTSLLEAKVELSPDAIIALREVGVLVIE